MKNIFTAALLTLSLNASAEIAKLDNHLGDLTDLFNLDLGSNQQLELTGTMIDQETPCTVSIINHTKISSTFPESSRSTRGVQISVLTDGDNADGASFNLSAQSLSLKFKIEARVGASTISYVVENREPELNTKRKAELKIVSAANGRGTRQVTVKELDRKVALTCIVSK